MSQKCPLCAETDSSKISPYKNAYDKFLSVEGIWRCNGCGMVYASPTPSDSELDQYYVMGEYYRKVGSGSESSDSFFNEIAMSRIQFIKQFAPLGKSGKCLDVGAGRGVFGTNLARIAPGYEYYAVEPDETCRESYGDSVAGKYEKLSLVDIRFDLVVANQVLEHVPRPVEFLKQLSTLMTPQGLLFIEVPFRDDQYKPDVEPHLLFWEIRTLTTALKKAGLQSVQCLSVGMSKKHAARLFKPTRTLTEKVLDPLAWAWKINRLCKHLGMGLKFDLNRQYELNIYGGDRQWIRCLAKKLSA